MKVIQINTYITGSTGKIAREIDDYLGGDNLILYGKGFFSSKNINYQNIGIRFEQKLDHLLSKIIGISGCYSIIATLRAINVIKKYKPDVIHLHNLHGYYINLYLLLHYIKKKQILTILTLHDEFMFTGNCGSAVPCEKWLDGCGNCEYIHEYPASYFFDWSSFLLKKKKSIFSDYQKLTIVTPSLWLANRVKRSILSNIKISTIANGIDTTLFSPKTVDKLREKLRLKNKKIALAVAPNLFDGRKGGEFIIQLANECKTENITFILIGVNKEIKSETTNLLMFPRIENQNELAEYYSLADLFIICSKSENFPTVCLEALSCGTPIIGFDTGGTKETAPSPLGTFVPYNDTTALKKELLTKIHMKDELTRQCRDYALKNYHSSIMAEKYFNIYKQESK